MKLGYVVIYVEDVHATLQFYRRAFDLEIRMEHESEGVVLYGEMETGGAVLGFASHELGQMNLSGEYQPVTPHGKPFGQEIAFVTDDVAGVFQRAVAAGAVALAEPTEKPWGQTVGYLRGIEGTLIELCSPMGEA